MKLEQSFSVQAPLAEVWSALIDAERVAPCLPGAEITERGEDGEYRGTFSVKLGPATAAYAGVLKIESADEAARVATMTAKGTDKRGQGGASATIVNRLHEDGDGTRVEVEADFTITGRLASFGRGGMIEDISRRLLQDFASCLQASLVATPAEALPAEEAPEAPPEEPATPSEEALADAAAASAGAAVSQAAVAATPPPEAESPSEAPVAPAGAPAAEGGGPAQAAEAPAAPRTESVAPPSAPSPQAATPPAAQAKPLSGFALFMTVLRGRLRRLFRRRRD
jgi:uncharacterized protein